MRLNIVIQKLLPHWILLGFMVVLEDLVFNNKPLVANYIRSFFISRKECGLFFIGDLFWNISNTNSEDSSHEFLIYYTLYLTVRVDTAFFISMILKVLLKCPSFLGSVNLQV